MRAPFLDDGDVTVYAGDCLDVMRELSAASVDAVVTDPPYGINFMGKAWDGKAIAEAAVNGIDHKLTRERSASMHAASYDLSLTGNQAFQAFSEAWAREAYRVLKPGGHLLAFAGTRTYHRMAAGVEDAGFEIRDCIAWMYGSGFPKSLDVSKAIDRRGDAEYVAKRRELILSVTAWIRETRDAAGLTNRDIDQALGTHGMAGHYTSSASQPHIPTADLWPQLLEVLGVELPPERIRDAVDEWLSVKGEPAPTWFAREVSGVHGKAPAAQGWKAKNGIAHDLTPKERRDVPATAEAAAWHGWGTALKPAFEPVVVARKPLRGTVAANVLEYGTGALNIDGCRIGWTDDSDRAAVEAATFVHDGRRSAYGDYATDGEPKRMVDSVRDAGRWPANVALDEIAADILDDQAPNAGGGGFCGGGIGEGRVYGSPGSGQTRLTGRIDANGGASRFFYTAKASRQDRNVGGLADNTHPTVKPTDLMRWLVRLVTPPGGIVLDPFGGSGSTGLACRAENVRCVLIEREPEYLGIIRDRLSQLSLFSEVSE